MGFLDILLGKGNPSSGGKGRKVKCPNCGADTALDQERCQACGTHISSMFRKKCPKCGEANEMNAERCTNCKYDFAVELARAKKTVYICPRCGYKADYFMMCCPSCNTKFG